MTDSKKNRCPYGTAKRRLIVSADKTTEGHILEAQSHLNAVTGSQTSLSVAITYLIREGHKALSASK